MAKGQGKGSGLGFQLSKGAKYIDLLTSGVNVYNQCDIDYYMRALSKATSNVSGIANQLVNTYFRSTETSTFESLKTALDSNDIESTAALLGQFTKDFLMTEIPESSEAGSW